MSIIMILFLLLSVLFSIIGTGMIAERMKTVSNLSELFYGRSEVVKDSRKIIQDFPVFGTGLGTFLDIFQKYKTFKREKHYSYAHNEPLQLIVETGILGFLLIFVFLFRYLKNILALWFKQKSPFAIYITLGVFIGVFSVSIHSFFDFHFHTPAVTLLFFVVLAMAKRTACLSGHQEDAQSCESELKIDNTVRIILIFIFCALFIFMESVVFRRYRSQNIFERVKERKVLKTGIEAAIEYQKLLREIDRAISLNPGNSSYFGEKANLLSQVALQEDLKEEVRALSEFGSREDILSKAEDYYQQAINLNPTRANYHLKLAWVYSMLGKADLTRDEAKKALILDHQNKTMQAYIEKELEGK